MKAVIPAAGQGTRLFPQTHTKPKPMVRVAGKPILGHILDNFVQSQIDDVVIVVGVMKGTVVEFVRDQYGSALDVAFVEQDSAEGLAHSVYQARPEVEDERLCIALGDMLFESGYERFISAYEERDELDGSIGVKVVQDPTNYGVAAVENGRITGLEEKPADPDSNLAISGIYFVEDPTSLFETIEYMLENDVRGSGDEYQLTDAFQLLVENGRRFGTFEVEEWYDCGRPETILEANRVLLERNAGSDSAAAETTSSVVIPPADVGSDVHIEASVVGPYVSVDDGATIVDSHVKDSIIGRDTRLEQVNLVNSLIGDSACVAESPNELNVGDSSEVQL